jgi:dTDP-4-dehydrorhamnose reductase
MANPEKCEANPAEAAMVNAEAPGVLAELCLERGARLVHFSSDYVLVGDEPGLKDEGAPTGPVNAYGRTKLEGERRVLACDPSALVCRVSWVFGTNPPGFIEEFLGRAMAGEKLEAAADKFSMPTSAAEIARIVIALLERPDLGGVFHLTHAGEPESWWSCGTKTLALAHKLGLLDDLKEVQARRMGEVARLAVPRPTHTSMISRRLREELGWPVVTWEEAAGRHFRKLLG